ncbi:MAG: hypothetical protein IJ409_06005, partial [Lachnospiraceae bacterium]|nr:hypothetical protein [Lachnospiraceae bacterium]
MMAERKMNPAKIGAVLFYVGLAIELLILLVDKSALTNPVEGYLFRISFLCFALKLCVTKYSVKEWTVIILCGVLAAFTYLVNGRDEVVRVVVFVAAMKGLDGKRVLKVVFWTTVAGMVLLALLSVFGVLGTVFEPGTGYGFKEHTTRFCFGVGNSNSFSIMIWALMTLGIYLYHQCMKLWHYGILLALSVIVYFATLSRTSLLMMIFTVILAVFLQYFPKCRESMWLYIGAIAGVFACLGFSVWAAYVSAWHEFLPDWIVKIDRILTGRITSLYAFGDGTGARVENWKLFGDPTYVKYFDMGYVRLFFWYGIIPGILCIVVLCLLIWSFKKNKDYMGLMLTLSFAIFTVVEAHAVSVYIARNYVLFLLGMYWMGM